MSELKDDNNTIDGWPMSTPLDIRQRLTQEADVNHPLRWGIISASAIASDWIKSLQDVPGASVTAVAARDLDRANAYAEAWAFNYFLIRRRDVDPMDVKDAVLCDIHRQGPRGQRDAVCQQRSRGGGA